jgi:tetratricopeptide (TPR) repeat protein
MRRFLLPTLFLLTVHAASVTPIWAAPAEAAPSKEQGASATAEAPQADAHGHDHDHEGEEAINAEARKPFGGQAANLDYLWNRSDKAFHEGDYARAITLHRAIVALDPTDSQSYGVAAWLMWSLGNGDEAVAHIRRGIAANPESADMWREAGEQYDLQKMHADAHDAYANAVKYSPKDKNTNILRRLLAHAAEKSGDLALSLKTWRGLARDFPDDAVVRNNLARVEKTIAGENPAVVA